MSSPVFSVKVVSVTQETTDVRSYFLEAVDGAELPAFSAGSHIDVHLGSGLIRQYSLCNGPADRDRYHIAVKRVVHSRGGSAFIHDNLYVGKTLEISHPKNNFVLETGEAPCLLLAGGIGITPLLSMARHLLEAQRDFELLYFFRTAGDAFQSLLSEADFEGRVIFHPSLPPEAVKAVLQEKLAAYEGNAHLYLCGPRVFMDLVLQMARDINQTRLVWPPEFIHLEYFAADQDLLNHQRSAFNVRIGRNGKVCVVAEDQTVVDALRKEGVIIETSCEQGICGTCLTGVLGGVPEHRDTFLTEAEKAKSDCMCPCVSRSLTAELVLDL